MAGLTCAQVLQQAGYEVVVLEKSRGVGGRMATRRSHDTRIDHGTCYLSPKAELFQDFISDLVEAGVVQIWTDCVYNLLPDGSLQTPSERSPRYVAAEGMSAIAKALAPNLDIQLNQRVVALTTTADHTWQLTIDDTTSGNATTASSSLEAKAVVVTVPAPQALELLAPLENAVSEQFIHQLRMVEFVPCIAVMAGYAADCLQKWQATYADMQAIASQRSPLAWVGLDSSKRRVSSQPVFVVQSTADFANTVLDATDLMPAGRSLLQAAADNLAPWLATPDWMQVHRWRYAFASRPLAENYLPASDAIAPLVCAGDWCGGMRAENALLSGLEAAHYLNQQLENRSIAAALFWRAIASPK